jgi:hypothetical protein
MPEQTLASSKSFNDDSIQKMFFTQALNAALRLTVPKRSVGGSAGFSPLQRPNRK